MRDFLLTFLMVIFTVGAVSQNLFEPGYFIDQKDQQVECLIKNKDWAYNPTEITYKVSLDSPDQSIGIQEIKGFGIYDKSKYVKARVEIDRSSDDLSKLTTDREPDFKIEVCLLKVLVDGHASLYQYAESNFNRFFYKVGDTAISQLIYKSFFIKGRQVGYNQQYKHQLFSDMQCDKIGALEINSVAYKEKDLTELFIRYNDCIDSSYSVFNNQLNRMKISLWLLPGFSLVNMHIINDINFADFDFEAGIGFSAGLGFEYFLPFNNNKWSVLIQPTYQSYQDFKGVDKRSIDVKYQTLSFPLFIRYYAYLNQSSKVFFNAGIAYDIDVGSEVRLQNNFEMDISGINSYLVGLGYVYKDRMSLELGYQTNRNFLSSYGFWFADYRTISVKLGYNILSKR